MKRLHDLPVPVVHGSHFRSYDGARHRRIIRHWLDEKERARAAAASENIRSFEG